MTNSDQLAAVEAANGPAVRRSVAAAARLVELWQTLKMNFAVLMSVPPAEPGWLGRLEAAAEHLRHHASLDQDVALYMLLQTAAHDVDHYSAHHSMLCALVVDLCAVRLDWPAEEIDALFHAALTMNLGMRALQDEMARQTGGPTKHQRQCVAEHPAKGVGLLQAAGVTDALWLDTVRRHHRPIEEGESGDTLQPSQRLAQLLQRVDVFTAKLSRRRSREGISATVAAREVCLDDTGRPDPIGAMLLRVLGLYPPGSYVRLAGGEFAVVTRRGAKAHEPIVACLRGADGMAMTRPLPRDSSDPRYGVRRGALASDLNYVLNHARVLGSL
jgi:hypothetical protein